MGLILIIPIIISIITTAIIIPQWIKKAKTIKLLWEDQNKNKKLLVAGSGGIAVITGIVLGILVYISINTFYYRTTENTIKLLAVTTSFLILAVIGLIDDLLGWRHGGLSKKFRMMMCLFAAIPLIVINSGVSTVYLPIIGSANIGWVYALAIIPLGIVATATTFNFLAGFNGLEAGQGIIIFTALGIATFITGNTWLTVICAIIIGSLIAFWKYNNYPAKVFPGDVLTYPLGGMIAIIAILGNIEKVAVIFFIPYIIELALKLRGGLKKQSFGKPNKNGGLEMPYKKVYGLEHLAIYLLNKVKKKTREKEVVMIIHALQLVFVLIGLLTLI